MVAVFSSIYIIFRLGQVDEDQGTDFDFFYANTSTYLYLLAKSERLLQGLFIGSDFFNIMGGL